MIDLKELERQINLYKKSRHVFEGLLPILDEKLADFPEKHRQICRLVGSWIEDVIEQQKEFEHTHDIMVIELKKVEAWNSLDEDMSMTEQKPKSGNG